MQLEAVAPVKVRGPVVCKSCSLTGSEFEEKDVPIICPVEGDVCTSSAICLKLKDGASHQDQHVVCDLF